MISISKIKAHNFKRFKLLDLELNQNHNVLIGDNESGKSSILSAIDLVLSGSRHRIDSIGLKNIFNVDVVNEYMAGQKKISDLPILFVELFLEGVSDPKFYGRTNSFKKDYNGIRLLAEPDSTYHNEIKIILNQTNDNFPFEYYSVNFKYFSDESYIAYTKPFKHVLIDSTQINNKTATFMLIKELFQKVSGKSIEESEVHIISVGGTSFKRYIEIGKKLKIKTAIITDNDKDYDRNIVKKYDGILDNSISVFAEKNNSISTFEIAIYDVNKKICDELFSDGRKKLTVLEYMLQNKADVAYHILDKKSDDLVCPDYIKNAVEWIIS